MKQKLSFGFIGGGRVTYFLLKPLARKNALPEKVIVADPDEAVRKRIQGISAERIHCGSNNKQAAQADVVFLAVHPPLIKEVLAEIQDELSNETIFISLAPVIPIEKLSVLLGGFKRIVRMIPNAPSIIHQGYNPVVYSDEIDATIKETLLNNFNHWGVTTEVKEATLEAYAIVTAMGPTYFWPQWIKLQELGRQFGITKTELSKAIPMMLNGAVNILYQPELSSQEVMDLIPIYPLEDEEHTINDIFQEKLTALYNKLTG